MIGLCTTYDNDANVTPKCFFLRYAIAKRQLFLGVEKERLKRTELHKAAYEESVRRAKISPNARASHTLTLWFAYGRIAALPISRVSSLAYRKKDGRHSRARRTTNSPLSRSRLRLKRIRFLELWYSNDAIIDIPRARLSSGHRLSRLASCYSPV